MRNEWAASLSRFSLLQRGMNAHNNSISHCWQCLVWASATVSIRFCPSSAVSFLYLESPDKSAF